MQHLGLAHLLGKRIQFFRTEPQLGILNLNAFWEWKITVGGTIFLKTCHPIQSIWLSKLNKVSIEAADQDSKKAMLERALLDTRKSRSALPSIYSTTTHTLPVSKDRTLCRRVPGILLIVTLQRRIPPFAPELEAISSLGGSYDKRKSA